jgi:hypothetical protein
MDPRSHLIAKEKPMFRINDRPTFTVPVPVGIAGAAEEQTLRTTFRVMSEEDAASHDASSPEGFKAFLRAVVVEFHDLVDDDEKPVPYSDATRDQLLAFIHVRHALNRAYWAAQTKARVGN